MLFSVLTSRQANSQSPLPTNFSVVARRLAPKPEASAYGSTWVRSVDEVRFPAVWVGSSQALKNSGVRFRMSKCPPFRIYLGDHATDLVALVRSEIVRKGGSVGGSGENGEFRVSTPVGSISARYKLDGKSIEVTIVSKPRLVSCAHIQDKMTDGVLDAKAMLRSRRD